MNEPQRTQRTQRLAVEMEFHPKIPLRSLRSSRFLSASLRVRKWARRRQVCSRESPRLFYIRLTRASCRRPSPRRLRRKANPFFYNDEHALLRFAEHDFVRRHAGFALRHFFQINLDASAAATRRLACRTS